ncbi:hypothetical protein ScPMuIL_010808 [Solemya velum]
MFLVASLAIICLWSHRSLVFDPFGARIATSASTTPPKVTRGVVVTLWGANPKSETRQDKTLDALSGQWERRIANIRFGDITLHRSDKRHANACDRQSTSDNVRFFSVDSVKAQFLRRHN